MKWRAVKFAIIQRVLLPVVIIVFRVIARTWRLDSRSGGLMDHVASRERAMLATYHGMGPSLLPFGPLMSRRGRRICLMTSPSRDGLVMDRVVSAFGVKTVKGSSRSKAVSGSIALLRAVNEGDVGVLMVDGSRGPRCVPQSGILRLAATCKATIFVVVLKAGHCIKFGSWDRVFLPLPFTRIRVHVSEFPYDPERESEEAALARLHNIMLDESRAMNSHIVEGIKPREAVQP